MESMSNPVVREASGEEGEPEHGGISVTWGKTAFKR